MDRRLFLGSTGATMLGLGLAPSFLRAAAAQAPAKPKVLVLLLQRGACDGLSVVPPLGESRYFDLRPNIRIPASGEGAALPLDGFFGLHPALSGLKPFWDEGSLAALHMVGSPDPTRSHFDAQDYLENGTPGRKSTSDGCLNRALQGLPAAGAFGGVALQPTLPLILQGPASSLAMGNLGEFQIPAASGGQGFESMYREALDRTLRGAGSEAFDAMKELKGKDPRRIPVAPGVVYPKGPLGDRLRQIAQLIKADLGLRIAVTDCGGWDTHVGQGDAKGQLANRLQDFGDAIAAFLADLKEQRDQLCLVTLTEFGRTVRENGNRGTDHGHGSVAFVMGGGVKGKRVIAPWKGLDDAHLNEARDMPVALDYRDLLGELLGRHLGIRDFNKVFPGYGSDPRRWAGVLKA